MMNIIKSYIGSTKTNNCRHYGKNVGKLHCIRIFTFLKLSTTVTYYYDYDKMFKRRKPHATMSLH